MRTDSTFLSADAIAAGRDYIQSEFGSEYLPDSPNYYGSKQNAQEAHEAIRPANVATPGRALVGVEPDAVRLYELIWRQFMACQMVPARFTSTALTVLADASSFVLVAVSVCLMVFNVYCPRVEKAKSLSFQT